MLQRLAMAFSWPAGAGAGAGADAAEDARFAGVVGAAVCLLARKFKTMVLNAQTTVNRNNHQHVKGAPTKNEHTHIRIEHRNVNESPRCQ